MHSVYNKLYGAAIFLVHLGGTPTWRCNLQGFANPTITKNIDQNVIDKHIYSLIFS